MTTIAEELRELAQDMLSDSILTSELKSWAERLTTLAERAEKERVLEGWKLVPIEPTETQWSGLARDIMMWLGMSNNRSPRSLLRHLELTGQKIPQWLFDEPEMQTLDHALSKGARVVILYRAMLADAPKLPLEANHD